MSNRAWGLLIVAAAAAAGMLMRGRILAQEEPPPRGAAARAADEPFAEKYVLIALKSDPEFGLMILEKPRARTAAGREFLVGIVPDDGLDGNFQEGREQWVAIDDVASITVYDKLADLQEDLQEEAVAAGTALR